MPGINTKIGINRLGSSSGSSWTHYWTQRIYDFGDSGLDKWVVTNPETTVAEFESLKGINMYTLNAIGSTVYSNNIKTFDSRASGCWVFSHLDVPCAGYPISYRRAGLINAANTAGCELLRDATGDESVLTFRIFTASTERYKVATTIKDLGIFKITIDASHKINLYALLNDVWVQQGVEQTWDIGDVSLFMSTKGTTHVDYTSKSTLRDIFIRDTDDLNVIPYYTHNRTAGVVGDGVTDNTAIINAALLTGNVYLSAGIYLLTESIKIPSNRTLFGKNCKILMGTQSLDNIIRNKDFDDGNVNTKIIGQGNFCLDSNSVNNDDYVGGVSYSTYGPVGWSPTPGVNCYRYWTIPMVNVDGFEISGINFIDYFHWCLVPQKATNGVIKDIYFNWTYLNADESNKDGIDILIGSNNIAISHIKGKTEDDVIGIFNDQHVGMFYPLTDWDVGSVHDITVDDIDIFETLFYGIRFLGESADGNRTYNIAVSNYKVRSCLAFLHVGLSGYYTTPPTLESLKDCTFDNVTVEACGVTGVAVVIEKCQNFVFTDLVNNSGRPDLALSGSGLGARGFGINGVFYPIPTISTATVENVNKDKVVITLNENCNESYVPATTDFALAGKTITSVTVVDAVVTLTVSVAYAYGDVITVDYTKPAVNYLRDLWGAALATFTDQAVANNIADSYPAILDDGNTVGWFDMNNNITSVADVVSAWGDKSGLDHHLLSGVGNRPLWTEDGVYFDGFNDYMKCDAFDLKQPMMIYAVIKQVAWASGDVLWDGNGASNRCGLTQVTSTPRLASFSVWTQNVINDNLAVDTWGIVRAIYNGASSSLQVDNTAKATGTNNNNEPDGFVLGGTYIGTGAANICVKALIIRKISDGADDQTAIYNYLATKFGLDTI
jgi:hypothetical protein